MRYRSLALGAAAILVAHAANATVYFDSVNVANPTSGADGNGDQTAAGAVSFTTSTPDFSQVSLLLSATQPSDSGSVTVYLVPDDGSGSGIGFAGKPTANVSGGVFQSFAGATVLGTIADSSLTTSPSLATINFSPAVAAAFSTPNEEYWIGLVSSTDSSALWYFAPGDDGIGETNQANFFANTAGGGGGTFTQLDAFNAHTGDTGGPYDATVSTPEPAAMAVFGVGIAGLGFVRRRRPKKA